MLRNGATDREGCGLDTIFFITSKVFWFLFRPETLLVALNAVGVVLLFRGRLRAGRNCVAVVTLALLTIGFAPLAQPLLGPLEKRYPPSPETGPPDGIIVLGGGEDDLASGYWKLPTVNDAGDRFLAALILANRFPTAPVIFTGGSGRLLGGKSGATVAEDLFLATGLPPERLMFERRSRNTAENAAFTFDMLPNAASGRWILVTSAFHMHRSVATFCAAGWRNLVPWPVDHRTSGHNWRPDWQLADNLYDLNVGLKEWVGVLGYRLLGRLSLPENVPGCLADPD